MEKLQVSRKEIDKKIGEFIISGDWNSVFVEGKDIQTELVHIDQTGRVIEATMKMGIEHTILMVSLKIKY